MNDDSTPAPHDHDVQHAADWNRMLHSEQSLMQVMETVAQRAQTTLPGNPETSVTLLRNQKPYTVAFTGSLAVYLDERQYDAGFGPCIDAAVVGHTIVIPDTGASDTYPDFGREALRKGVRSTVSVPLGRGGTSTAGLNIYVMRETSLPDLTAAAEQFATHASVALINAAEYQHATEAVKQLEAALQSRAVIEQAKGIIMAKRFCDADHAFEHLTGLSQRTNRKLREVAQEIVHGVKDK